MQERRRHVRKKVMETFQIFIVVPSLGPNKLYLDDISMQGLRFMIENAKEIKKSEEFLVLFYVNTNLHLPLYLKVAHVAKENDQIQKVGCEVIMNAANQKACRIFSQFVEVLDGLTDFM